MNKALFLDRDGTLVVDTHYLHNPEDVQLIPGVTEALSIARDAGYLLFLFTNQSGIGRGYYLMEDVLACNREMIHQLGFKEDPFLETCIAPESPDEMEIYRKPSPKFLLEMLEKHDLDPDSSWMVGDKLCDVEAGVRAGIRSAYVLSGKDLDVKPQKFIEKNAIPVFEDLTGFVAQL